MVAGNRTMLVVGRGLLVGWEKVEVRMAADGYSFLRPFRNACCSVIVAGESVDGVGRELLTTGSFFGFEKLTSIIRAG